MLPAISPRTARQVWWLLGAMAVGAMGAAGIWSRHWQLVNDPAQLQYARFMVDHGFTPYGQLIEMNMPGIYMVHGAAARAGDGGPYAWRAFDACLLVLLAGAMVWIASATEWIAGLVAAALFALSHTRDGPGELGQRDLIISVMLVCAYAFFFHAMRRQAWGWMAGCGFFFGVAAAIKPTPLLLVPLIMVMITLRWRPAHKSPLPPVAALTAGLCLPLCACVWFLLAHHAVHPFLHALQVYIPYYGSIARKPLSAVAAAMLPLLTVLLLLLACAVLAMRRGQWRDWEQWLLLLGLAFGAASELAQHKGFTYHRYPMMAFLCLWALLQFAGGLRDHRRPWAQWASLAGLVYVMLLGAHYMKLTRSAAWADATTQTLESDLQSLGGNNLSGKVQCLATMSDCDTALYHMKLVQATGLFYDFFLFGAARAPAVKEARQRSLREMQARPPRVFVMDSGGFPTGYAGYTRIDAWPQFADFLQANYRLQVQRSFSDSRADQPLGYRIYVLANDHGDAPR
jgi:hypothetical protein